MTIGTDLLKKIENRFHGFLELQISFDNKLFVTINCVINKKISHYQPDMRDYK